MHLTLVNLLGVATVAFVVPFVLAFFPRVRIPSVTLELVAGQRRAASSGANGGFEGLTPDTRISRRG